MAKNDPTLGHIGGIFRCVELKVSDLPEMNYFSTDKNDFGEVAPRGEVNIIISYYTYIINIFTLIRFVGEVIMFLKDITKMIYKTKNQ